MSTQSHTVGGTLGRWRENPERMAWSVLAASFAIFAFLAVAIPAAAVYTLQYATRAQTARLEPTIGTLLLFAGRNSEPLAITSLRENIEEGARVVATDDSTQATLSLNSDPATNEILGSVQIYTGTDLMLSRLRRPMFASSNQPFRADLNLDAGQARVFTNTGTGKPILVRIRTPHGLITLTPGSYQVSVNENETEVTVRSGLASLSHDEGHSLDIAADQRAWMTSADLSSEVSSPEQNLVDNGNFTPPALDSWPSYQIAEGSTTPGKVQFSEGEDGRQVAQFVRMGEEKMHTEVGIRQEIDKPVNVYDDLRIQLDVKTLFQSLPGAGSLNSEFPLRVEVAYTDVYGKDLTWGHGFYYREPEAGEAYPKVVDGTRVNQGQWYTYVSPNLIQLLNAQGTRPSRINSIRIYASGHNYQSMVSEVYVLAQ